MQLMENAEIAKLDVFGTKAKIMEENENETKYRYAKRIYALLPSISWY